MHNVALYASGANPGHIESALLSSAKTVVLCLEDGTPEDKKLEARFLVKHALSNGALRREEQIVVVRINGIQTDHIEMDLKAILLGDSRPDRIRVPMIKNLHQFEEFINLLSKYNYKDNKTIELMIENTEIISCLNQILSSHANKIACITIGGEDLRASLSRGSRIENFKKKIIDIADSYSIPTLETTFMDYTNLTALKEDTKKARSLGFHGRSVVHPTHVAVCEKIFME